MQSDILFDTLRRRIHAGASYGVPPCPCCAHRLRGWQRKEHLLRLLSPALTWCSYSYIRSASTSRRASPDQRPSVSELRVVRSSPCFTLGVVELEGAAVFCFFVFLLSSLLVSDGVSSGSGVWGWRLGGGCGRMRQTYRRAFENTPKLVFSTQSDFQKF